VTGGPGTRLVEELRLLLEAVADRAGPWLDRVAAGGHDEHEHATAAWCPACAALALIKGESAEAAARGLARAADLVALLRAVLADRWEPGVPHMPGFRPPPRPDPRVQRIPIRRKEKPD
jgi:hypothetical protein